MSYPFYFLAFLIAFGVYTLYKKIEKGEERLEDIEDVLAEIKAKLDGESDDPLDSV